MTRRAVDRGYACDEVAVCEMVDLDCDVSKTTLVFDKLLLNFKITCTRQQGGPPQSDPLDLVVGEFADVAVPRRRGVVAPPVHNGGGSVQDICTHNAWYRPAVMKVEYSV